MGVSVDEEGVQEPWSTPRLREIKKNQPKMWERTTSEISRKPAAHAITEAKCFQDVSRRKGDPLTPMLLLNQK